MIFTKKMMIESAPLWRNPEKVRVKHPVFSATAPPPSSYHCRWANTTIMGSVHKWPKRGSCSASSSPGAASQACRAPLSHERDAKKTAVGAAREDKERAAVGSASSGMHRDRIRGLCKEKTGEKELLEGRK